MISVGVITVSDRGSRGEREDRGGPLISQIAKDKGWEVKAFSVIPDEQKIIEAKLIEFADVVGADIIFTTGGTGFSQRDVTPEATLAVVERLAPGLAEAMRQESLKITPMAMLSRATAGIRGKSIIVNLPGSPKAVKECLDVVLPALGHGVEILKGEAGDCAETLKHPHPHLPEPVPLINIVAARSGTGKTTFMEKLIGDLVSRGYKVGTIKSDVHGFEVDVPGKDTWRFTQAGAKATAIIGPSRFALIQQTQQKKDLYEVAGMMEDVDLILVEGYRQAELPKIEVVRREKGTEVISPLEYLLAVVTDLEEIDLPVPIYHLDDYMGVADLIISKFLSE